MIRILQCLRSPARGGTERGHAAEMHFNLGVYSNMDALHGRPTGLARLGARADFPNDERHDADVAEQINPANKNRAKRIVILR